ncbi:DUF6954 family protein [Neobacillus soli]|uniref:DUF6954 family protein n=1 Tax=Neobacillus soli TaxID=220688 RepID=UPI000824FA08|nr:hypothetical protein [Neobacillus soli]
MRYVLHVVFIILIGLVTFFGLGPVLFADGVLQERLLTAAAVLFIYIVLVIFYRIAINWANKR